MKPAYKKYNHLGYTNPYLKLNPSIGIKGWRYFVRDTKGFDVECWCFTGYVDAVNDARKQAMKIEATLIMQSRTMSARNQYIKSLATKLISRYNVNIKC